MGTPPHQRINPQKGEFTSGRWRTRKEKAVSGTREQFSGVFRHVKGNSEAVISIRFSILPFVYAI